MEMEPTAIVKTVETLGAIMLTYSGVIIFTLQYLKEKWDLKDKKAEILSLVFGFISSGLTSWAWIASIWPNVVLPQWIGLGFFMLVGTLSPSGGYKFLGAITGKREIK